ncbi:MAG: hypothetical protein ACRBCS_02000 [Cellvibrionaceae bacterium]
MHLKKFSFFILLLSVSHLIGCTDDGDSDSSVTNINKAPQETTSEDDAGSIMNTDETESIATASIETTKAILLSEKTASFLPTAASLFVANSDPIETIKAATNTTALNLTTAGSQNISGIPGECGGTAALAYDINSADGELTSRPLSVELNGDMNEFCNWFIQESSELILDGNVSLFLNLDSNNSGFVDIDYDLHIDSKIPDFTYTGHHTYKQYCSYSDMVLDCSESATHTSTTGIEFTLDDTVVKGNKTEGFRALAVLHNNNGQTFEVTIKDILLCDNGNIQHGLISLENTSNMDESITLNFSSCNSAVISHHGNSWVMQQPSTQF